MIRLTFITAALFWCDPAHAHLLDSANAGFAAGFAHPFAGLDHLAAMVGAGIWAAQIGGRALWAVPAAFVGTMILGAVAGFVGGPIQAVEIAVVLSGVVFGGLIVLARKWPVSWAAGLSAAFAFAHGYAHAAELPQAAAPIAYVAAFLIATALLHLAGIAVYWAIRVAQRTPVTGTPAVKK
jgi:urease accessory protein